jgi:hypothetical protein
MSPSIEIDDDVFDVLKRHAEPFVDTPNDVLRRLLLDAPSARLANTAVLSEEIGVASRRREASPNRNARGSHLAAESHGARKRATKRKRARSSDLLSEDAYEVPILRVLDEASGRLPTSEAVAAVGEMIADQLKPMDHEVQENGRERWQMRVQFTRLRLVERELLKGDSPRGIWEISDAGRELLRREMAAA